MRRTLWLFALLLTWPVHADAAQIKVCASGCPYTNSQLQDALNAAVDGDEVLLESGFTYVAAPTSSNSYLLGQRCNVPVYACITVRTGVTSTGSVIALSNFPGTGIRIDTSYRTASTGKAALAKIIPGTNNVPSVRTVYPGEVSSGLCTAQPCVGSGWTLKWLEFGPRTTWLSRAYVLLGANIERGSDPNGNGQDKVNEVPRYFEVIQCDFHGDPFGGQYQALILSSGETRVIGNSFRDFKSLSEDTAITSINALGPHIVENNYIEGSTENILWGGSDPYLIAYAIATGTPTSTVIAMNTPVWWHRDGATATETASFLDAIYSGIFVAIAHGGIWYSGTTCTLSAVTATTATCTIAPALPFTPTVGDWVRWNWDAGGVTIRYNHLTKPLSWRDPIIATPTGVGVKAGGGGSLASGTYCYRVQARAFVSGNNGNDPNDKAYSRASAEQCVTTSGAAAISWSAVANTQTYRVYGRASGAESQFWTVTAPATTFTDTGTSGTTTAPPEFGYTGGGPDSEAVWNCASDGQPYSCWKVKNSFELKHCDGAGPAGSCLVEFNIIENDWCCMQDNVVAIKVQDQDGEDYSATVRNLIFRNNWVRTGQRAINVMGTEQGGANHGGGTMTDVIFSNNLFTALNSSWNPDGGWYQSNSALGFSGGGYTHHVGPRNCVRCSFIHNTFTADNNNIKGGPLFWNMDAGGDTLVDFILRDNIMARTPTDTGMPANVRGLYSLVSDTNQGVGTSSWDAAVSGTSSATYNAWPESNSTLYSFSTCGGVCGSGYYPSQATLQTYFTNYSACSAGSAITGCALNGTSPLDNAASDKTDVGANIAAMQDGIAIALSGDLSGGTPEPPVTPTSAHGVRIRLRGGH